MKSKAFSVVLALTVFLTGFFLAGLFQSGEDDQSASLVALYEETRRTVAALKERHDVLESTHRTLLAESNKMMAVVEDPGEMPDLITSWRDTAVLAGLTAVEGTGLTVQLNDKEDYNPLVDPVEGLIHDGTLNHVLTLLINSGARALSVNGIRLTAVSQIYCIGPTILCYNERLVPPYEISAIGPTEEMALAVESDAMLERLSGPSIGLRISVTKPETVRLPSYAERGDYLQLMGLLKEK